MNQRRLEPHLVVYDGQAEDQEMEEGPEGNRVDLWQTLSLVEFLLKNGPRNAISDMQNEQYTFKGLETFSCTVDGADKG